MEKIVKEGKNSDIVLGEILSENDLQIEDVIYSTKLKKGKLFKSDSVEVTVYKKDELIEEIKKFLNELISNMGIEVSFELKKVEDRIIIKIYSDNNSILIGKNGNTIKALEEILRQYIITKYDIHFKVNLDVENYRE